MPELPELEVLRREVGERIAGATAERCELASIAALKTYAPPLSDVVGRRVDALDRRGKYLCLRWAGEQPRWLVTHLARAGWLRWYDSLPAARARPSRSPVVLRLGFEGGFGFDLTEMGTQKRLAVWMVEGLDRIPALAELGPDPLDAAFDLARLASVLEGEGATLKTILTDQRRIAGIGNAYSDEILHVARLSPFRPGGRLDHDEVVRLHEAIASVLEEAVEGSHGLKVAELKDGKRTGMRVHGRTGESCPECGDTVRQVAYADRSLQYCPTCQTEGRVLADRRMSRLLK